MPLIKVFLTCEFKKLDKKIKNKYPKIYGKKNELPLNFALYLPLYFNKNFNFLAPYFLSIAPF